MSISAQTKTSREQAYTAASSLSRKNHRPRPRTPLLPEPSELYLAEGPSLQLSSAFREECSGVAQVEWEEE